MNFMTPGFASKVWPVGLEPKGHFLSALLCVGVKKRNPEPGRSHQEMKEDNKTIRGKFFSLSGRRGGERRIACGKNKIQPSRNIWLIRRRKLTREQKICWVIIELRVKEAPSVAISSRPDLNMQLMGGSTLLQIDSPHPPLRGTAGKSTTPRVTLNMRTQQRQHSLAVSRWGGEQVLGSPPAGKQKKVKKFCQEYATWCHHFLFLSVW